MDWGKENAMTPDMKRLCEAVDRCAHSLTGLETWEEEQEAIVRAVLSALREPSRDCLHMGGLEAMHHEYRARGSANERVEVAGDTLRVMIDHILADGANP